MGIVRLAGYRSFDCLSVCMIRGGGAVLIKLYGIYCFLELRNGGKMDGLFFFKKKS